MKKKAFWTKLYIALFVLFLIGPWAAWGILAVVFPEVYLALNGTLNENRNLREFSLEDLSGFIDDHAPFRESCIHLFQGADQRVDGVYQAVTGKISEALYQASPVAEDNSSSVLDFFGTEQTVAENSAQSLPTEASDTGDAEPGLLAATAGLETDPEPAHEHSYTVAEEVLPSCETAGYRVYVCECGDSYTETLEATGHTGTLVAESEASFTTYGYKEWVCETCGKTYRTDIEDKLRDTSYFAPRVVGEGTLLGRSDWLFYTGNTSVKYYKGENLLDEETLDLYARKAQYLKELCDENGIELYIMFMPNKEQVYDEYMPTYEIAETYKRTARLTDYLNEHTDVPAVYPLTELDAYDFYWQTYYRNDTHWNYAGAFIGLQELYRIMGKELTDPLTLSGSLQDVIRYDLVDIGGLSHDKYNGDKEFLFAYRPEITVDGLNENNVCRMTSDSPNEEKLVMLADSFRIMMLPYISKDFRNCTIAHRDYVDSVKKDILDCDILILAAAERYDNRLFGKSMDRVIEFLGGSFE